MNATKQSAGRASRVVRLVVAGALAGLAGCTPRAASSYEVMVRSESEPGKPLSGATVSFNAQVVGTSDARGRIALRLRGNPGDIITLQPICPEGYRVPREPLTVVLRTLTEQGKKAEYQLSCPPLTRNMVLAVRATNGAHLPVRYLGKEIARTDDSGAAHALLKVSPGDTLAVQLDTSGQENEKLMPQNPELKLTVPERDEIVVFDQTFTKPKPPRKKRVKPEPVGPQRI